jgi:hypothetical protein
MPRPTHTSLPPTPAGTSPATHGARREPADTTALFNDGYSPTTDTAQPGSQRPIQARFDMTVPISLIRLALLLRRLRVPQVDVQTLDLFDQQENRLSRRAKLLIAVRKKTRAPGAELLDLALVQTIAQRSVHQGQGSVRQP